MSASIKLSSRPTREFWEIPVLYEDEQLLALDKPCDLPVAPLRDDPEGPSLLRLLRDGIQAGAAWATSRGLGFLTNAHRLDPDITGVLLLAKTKAALIHFAEQFGSGTPRLLCLALVQGTPAEDEFTVEAPLAPDAARPGLVRVDPRSGRRAITRFVVLERFASHALLRCEPQTHRAHQIRAHLRSRRMPVASDPLYGGHLVLLSRLKPDYRFKQNRDEIPLIQRPALHVEEITVKHPTTGEPITVRSPWPKDLSVALKYLRRYASASPPPPA